MTTQGEIMVFVFGMRRSGHHAVMQWLTDFYDDVVHIDNPRLNSLWSSKTFVNGERTKDIEAVRGRYRQVTMLNFEDGDFQIPISEYVDAIGEHKEHRNILVVRDPFNCFASRLRKHHPVAAWDRWKRHAREYLGVTEHLGPSAVKINYNYWFASSEYRIQTARQFGFAYGGKPLLEVVPRKTRGSSFTGMDYEGRAHDMKVLSRWREHIGEERFLSAFDSETVELASDIFCGGLRGLSIRQICERIEDAAP